MANEKRNFIDRDDLIDSLGASDMEIFAKAVIGDAPTVDAYTEEQVTSIIQQADKMEAKNKELEKELAWLKSCLNCKIRKECPRHCGKVVHDCDHWEHGDSTVDAVEVVRCKDCKHWEEYNACDGTKPHRCMNHDAIFYKRTAPDDFCSYGERKDGE